MADGAAFDLRFMLVDKRSLFLGVAFVADLVSRCVRSQLLRPERPMWAVAIVALDESFIDAVMKGARKLRTHAHVACVTELRSLGFHQVLAFFGVMRRMAIGAGDTTR